MNSRILLLLSIAILAISPLTTILSASGSPDLPESPSIPRTNRDVEKIPIGLITDADVETLDIVLEYPTARFSAGLYGYEIIMDGVEMDPTPGSMRLPREILEYKLPLGTVIDDIRLEAGEVNLMAPGPAISRSDSPRPSNYLELWDGIEEIMDPPTDHITWDMGTGIDTETGTRVAYLSIFIYPVVLEGDRFRSLVSGSISIDHHLEPAPLDFEIYPMLQEEYDLLVLCDDAFLPTISNYADYRNLTGTMTRVVTIDQIETGSIWQVEGRDIQERIKRFIYNATLYWGIEYLLLVGDADRFPVRHIMVLDGSDDTGGSRTDGRFVPSDLYYSDVFDGGGTDFSAWNDPAGDSELLWGEYDSSAKDDPDLYPDLYVGRIPASTQGELDNMIDKIQGYELTARGSVWFYNATLCGTDTFPGGTPEGEYTSDTIESSYLTDFNVTKHYDTLGTLSGISATVNDGCGFFEMSDHGTYTSWAGAYSTSHAYNQKNGYKLPVVVMDACLTHGFDNENASSSTMGKDPVFNQYYYAPGASGSGTECVGEQTHRAPDGGSIASFGCTRIGWGVYGTAYITALSGYMNTRIHKAYSDGLTRPGQMLAKAVSDYRTRHGVSSASGYKTMTEYILLGDPSVYIGGISATTVEIESETDEILAGPGSILNINYTLSNTGFLAAPFNITVDTAGRSTHSFSVSVNRTDYMLLPGGNSSGMVTITVPGDGSYLEEDDIIISADSILFNKPRKASIRVIVDRISEVSSEPYPSPIICDSGASLTGNIRINNLGNGQDHFLISIEDLPDGWTMTLGKDNIPVDSLDYERIHFMLNVSAMAPAGIYFIGTSVNSTITGAVNLSEIRVEVRPSYDISIGIENATIEVLPESTGIYNVTLFNDGNSQVNVSLDLIPRQDDLFEVTGPQEDLVLDPFSALNVPLGIIPFNGTEPRSYPLTLTANDGNTTDEMILTALVQPSYMFLTGCSDPSRILGDSLDASFSITITNIGNIRDSYLISLISDNDLTWDDYSSDSGIKVEPGDSANASIFIRTDHLPLHGSYGFRLRVGTTSGIGNQDIPVTVVVRELYNHSITAEFRNVSIYPADVVNGTLIVNSSANGNDNYLVSADLPDGWIIDFGSTRLEASAFQVVSENFSVTASDDALAGKYQIDFLVSSMGSNATRSISKFIFIKEVFQITWEISGMNQGSSIDPGDTANITLTIFNGGNIRDTVEITLSSWAIKWMSLKDSTIFIDPGANATTQITIRIPYNATAMTFSIGIKIDSMGTDDTSETITVNVGDPGGSNNEVMPWYSYAVIASILVLLVLIMGGLLYANNRKHSGVSVEEAGIEWSEDDEDDWDE